jgi:uncharacterized protein (TIGR03437 family)
MMNLKKILVNSSLIALAIIPPVLYSYEYGPDPGYTGAPGDNPTGCTASGCHVGAPGTGPGSITISAGGTTYTPGGPAQQITVTVTDSTEKKYGFELTSRIDSTPTNDAGTLASTDGNTQVVTCATSISGAFYTGSCGNSLHWIEHTDVAFLSSANKAPSFTYTFNWTPPATNVGTVTLYAAGNAGTGNTSSPLGTDTYLTKLQLSPSTGGTTNPNAPTIKTNGVNPNDSASNSIQPSSWVSIYGTNLAPSAVQWTGNYPTSLGGTMVTINNKPAYLSYVSPTQINLEAPDDTSTGTVNVTVTNANGTATSTVTLAPASPAWSMHDATHVAAIILRSNGTGAYGGGTYDIVGPTGSSLGYPTVAAKAGDSVVLFGIGFGPTSPTVPAGVAFSGAAPITSGLQMTLAGQGITPAFAGESSTGLYQFNITIPAGLGTGDKPLTVTVGGASAQSGVVLSLQ